MRIISKFHDYYDSAMGHGADPTLVYERKLESGSLVMLPPGLAPEPYTAEHYRVNSDTKLTIVASRRSIVFCGKLYRRAIVEATLHVTDQEPRKFYFYGEKVKDTVASTFAHLVGDAEFDHKVKPETARGYVNLRNIPSLEKENARRRFYRWNPRAELKEGERDPLEGIDWLPLHRQNEAPVFEVTACTRDEKRSLGARSYEPNQPDLYRLVKNPVLAEVGFQQVFPPFQAYQEIDMYLGGVMGGNGRPMVQLNDKELLMKHGFDGKTSFRKPKEGAK